VVLAFVLTPPICYALAVNSEPKDPVSAAEDLGTVKYVSAYDGDTITVDIPSMPVLFGQHIRVRISHIDAPELKSRSSCERKAALQALSEVSSLLSRSKTIELIDPKRDKYFRILSDVAVDGKTILSKHLLDKGLAVPYEGGAKKHTDWCSKIKQK
jgi:endonuclease YncB( thermonuclease family)